MGTKQVFQEEAQVFSRSDSTKPDVITAGENAIVALYHDQAGNMLDVLRLQRFHRKVGKSTACVHPQMLPPTSAAAQFHSMRVYLQIQQWMGCGDRFQHEDWGWYEQGGKYLPVLTDKEAAPPELLDVVR